MVIVGEGSDDASGFPLSVATAIAVRSTEARSTEGSVLVDLLRRAVRATRPNDPEFLAAMTARWDGLPVLVKTPGPYSTAVGS